MRGFCFGVLWWGGALRYLGYGVSVCEGGLLSELMEVWWFKGWVVIGNVGYSADGGWISCFV